MAPSWRPNGDRASRAPLARAGLVALALVLAAMVAAVLEGWTGVDDASPVFLVAVVIAAALLGTSAAVVTSFSAFLLYDFLFTVPRFTLQVADPAEWVSLLLFLIVAVVIGRLTAAVRERAEEADRRVREGMALVAMSRDSAMAETFGAAAAVIAPRLLEDAEMEAVWVTAGPDGRDVVAAAPEDGRDAALARAEPPWVLVRDPDGGDGGWLRSHASDPDPRKASAERHYLVPIVADAGPAGAIHALRPPADPEPGRGARRLLILAADQLGAAARRDRLQAELTGIEVARRGDALRGAILDSVSHDLRTPIASIRALAGGLADAAGDPEPAAARAAAEAIDAEAARLAGIVNGLLDMGRVQAGAVTPDLRPYEVEELVETAVRRVAGGARRAITVRMPEGLPPVIADAVLFDVAVGNAVDNALVHAGPAPIAISAGTAGGRIAVVVEDGGPGVPDEVLPRLFERFYRGPETTESGRRGIGMGLAIARGFVEAMGGTIAASRSTLGGLAIRIELPAGPEEVP